MKNSPQKRFVYWFEDLKRGDIPLAGGKCANLGELTNAGVPVPIGFSISANAYKSYITETGIADEIYEIIKKIMINDSDPQRYEEASRKVRKLIESTPMPSKITEAIEEAYDELCHRTGKTQTFVAVRSSATAEDLPDASFAGQQETYLNVRGSKNLVEKTIKCWSSLFTPRAIFYRNQKGFKHEDVFISVCVQKMVNSKAAGVAFTLNPVSGNVNQIVIEGSWGLGESVVSGYIIPDNYIVDKNTLKIIDRKISEKTVEYVRDDKTGETLHVEVSKERRRQPCLTDDEIMKIAKLAKRIEEHYDGKPQDIEWAIDRDLQYLRNVFIVQSRPETIWGIQGTDPSRTIVSQITEQKVLLKGLSASPGFYTGTGKVVMSPIDAAKLVKKGDILVTPMTLPDWVPYMRIAGAIITDDGGITCHAAIVSRELGIPCIVGTGNATEVLKTGQNYTVDANNGVIYEGIIEDVFPREPDTPVLRTSIPVTATRIYVNLSLPEIAEKVFTESQPDGVGLLRAEHLMLNVGKHPRLIIEEGGEEKMVEAFAEGVKRVAEVFAPRPVVYRFLDFKPDEFLGLPGGEKYEKEAGHVGPNPLIGYRGCFRYIKESDVFRLECRAIKRVREKYGLVNVWVMLPFVRTLKEFRIAKKLMEEEGLIRGPDFKLWIMVEVPSSGILIDKFIEEGIDGVSFGTNDYTALILGLDRNDASVQELYDERNLAVLRLISHVIRICRAHNITTSICGQAPSNYPEYLEFLIREGATSISVNPDVVVQTRLMTARIERKLLLEERRDKDKPFFAAVWSEELR